MCAKILEHAGKLNMDEYNFFLRGGVVRILVDSFILYKLALLLRNVFGFELH